MCATPPKPRQYERDGIVVIDMMNPVHHDTPRSGMPPETMLAEIPSIKAADEAGCPTAYLRFYEEDGRGEWYVMGLDDNVGFAFVVSPWGKGPMGEDYQDEFGTVLIDDFHATATAFGCGPIHLDADFKPTPFDSTTLKLVAEEAS